MAKKISTVKGKKNVKEQNESPDVPTLQTTGALNPHNPAKLLTELLNRGKSSPFGNYQTLPEYSTALRGMTANEMHKHAVEDVEIVPIDDRNRLIERLEKEFAIYKNKMAGYTQKIAQSDLTPERRKAIEAILQRAQSHY